MVCILKYPAQSLSTMSDWLVRYCQSLTHVRHCHRPCHAHGLVSKCSGAMAQCIQESDYQVQTDARGCNANSAGHGVSGAVCGILRRLGATSPPPPPVESSGALIWACPGYHGVSVGVPYFPRHSSSRRLWAHGGTHCTLGMLVPVTEPWPWRVPNQGGKPAWVSRVSLYTGSHATLGLVVRLQKAWILGSGPSNG